MNGENILLKTGSEYIYIYIHTHTHTHTHTQLKCRERGRERDVQTVTERKTGLVRYEALLIVNSKTELTFGMHFGLTGHRSHDAGFGYLVN